MKSFLLFLILFSSLLLSEDMRHYSAMQKWIMMEKGVIENPFVILPHRPNYLLPMSYSEGLIYYNHATERFSLGVKLTDWLWDEDLVVKIDI